MLSQKKIPAILFLFISLKKVLSYKNYVFFRLLKVHKNCELEWKNWVASVLKQDTMNLSDKVWHSWSVCLPKDDEHFEYRDDCENK